MVILIEMRYALLVSGTHYTLKQSFIYNDTHNDSSLSSTRAALGTVRKALSTRWSVTPEGRIDFSTRAVLLSQKDQLRSFQPSFFSNTLSPTSVVCPYIRNPSVFSCL